MNDRGPCLIACLLLAPLAGAHAQGDSVEVVEQQAISGTVSTMATPVTAAFGDFSAQYVGVQHDSAGAVVTGAPYSATGVTESVQMLHDGNRIRNRNEARLYRDSQGRTRREQQLNFLGAWQLAAPVSPLVFVHDPVAEEGYMLDIDKRTARRFSMTASTVVDFQGADSGTLAIGSVAGSSTVSAGTVLSGAPASVAFTSTTFSVSTEELGERDIDGVTATGTLVRMTMAADTIGNEMPIEVVTERWYSDALQTIVMHRHSDPRFGETTYRLTNLSTDEPDAALFKVPADFTILE